MDGLEIFVQNKPGFQWNGDKKVLRKLKKHPKQKYEILKKFRNDEIKRRLSVRSKINYGWRRLGMLPRTLE